MILPASRAGKLRSALHKPMGIASSPIQSGDLIVLQVDQEENSYLAAFDRRNGEMRWRTAREERQGLGHPIHHHTPDGKPLILTAGAGDSALTLRMTANGFGPWAT